MGRSRPASTGAVAFFPLFSSSAMRAGPGSIDPVQEALIVNTVKRVVEKEWLDELPADDPRAARSRRDLRLINAFMGNHRWLLRKVAAENGGAPTIVEAGAGDGGLATKIAKALPAARYRAVEPFVPVPGDLPSVVEWQRADLREEFLYEGADLLLGCLILHQFEETDLSRIGETVMKSSLRRMLFTEPRRSALHVRQLRAGKLLGFNEVTLHDGPASIRAGFRGAELPRLLGLGESHWNWRLGETTMGAYRMEAWRK